MSVKFFVYSGLMMITCSHAVFRTIRFPSSLLLKHEKNVFDKNVIRIVRFNCSLLLCQFCCHKLQSCLGDWIILKTYHTRKYQRLKMQQPWQHSFDNAVPAQNKVKVEQQQQQGDEYRFNQQAMKRMRE